ncbi:MAG: phosphate/phosphite/phosphonate ABC transporter substrate-binding protein [Gammaproteobacteria bacterium]|nr:phosphate/phosphite/phosphonate ABC transporter substrate-binding protein [Gammaproteobacteria bacterium]
MNLDTSFFRIIPFVFFLFLFLLKTANAGETLIMGVHPFLSPAEVEKKFIPLANYLSKQTGINIEVKVGSSYQQHIQYVGLDKVDIAYIGPAAYVIMEHQYGEKPMLAKLQVNGHSFFQGNIVVRKDSGIKTIDALKGKRIAFGDPNSTMSYIVPHDMLHQAGVFTGKPTAHEFLHSHDNVALGVLMGDFDAGAVKPAVFKKFENRGLHTVAMTPKISEHLFVTRKNLPQHQVNVLRSAMLKMNNTASGQDALKAIKKSVTGLMKASSSDYDNLRKIIIDSKWKH